MYLCVWVCVCEWNDKSCKYMSKQVCVYMPTPSPPRPRPPARVCVCPCARVPAIVREISRFDEPPLYEERKHRRPCVRACV